MTSSILSPYKQPKVGEGNIKIKVEIQKELKEVMIEVKSFKAQESGTQIGFLERLQGLLAEYNTNKISQHQFSLFHNYLC